MPVLLLLLKLSKALQARDYLDKWLAQLRECSCDVLYMDIQQVLTFLSGVAVGSSIGHAIGGFFGGGSSQSVEQQENGAVAAQGQEDQNTNWGARSCEVDAKQFTKCLDENNGNMQICSWYLEQLVSLLKTFRKRDSDELRL